MYLKVNNFPKEKKVYVVGEEGIVQEVNLVGYVALGGPDDAKQIVELKPNYLFEHDKNVGAVIVGLDQHINYYKLQYATLCICENPGCLFIASNRDAVGHLTNKQEWPGAGCMVAAVCGATEREPEMFSVVVRLCNCYNILPPSEVLTYMRCNICRFNTPPSRMCMVGDRLDIDILFGQNSGCKTLLVLSGVTNLATVQDSSNHIQPEYHTSKIYDILGLLKEEPISS